MNQNITEIKIFRCEAEKKYINETIETVNTYLKHGWILLDISTLGPIGLPGEYAKSNYFTYHLGKLKEIETTKI